MSAYNEFRQTIHKLRCKEEVLFRMAVSHLMDVGARHLTEENIVATCQEIMKEDDTKQFMTNEFKCAIVRMAGNLATIPHSELLTYISREVYYSVDNGFGFQRAVEIIRKLIDRLEYDAEDSLHLYEIMQECDVDDDELKFIGYDYMIPTGDCGSEDD